jgi:hypothetical protein
VIIITLAIFLDIHKWHTFQNVTHSDISYWKWKWITHK